VSIAFSNNDWQRIRDTYNAWWNHELDRPILQLVVPGNDPGRTEPELPRYDFQSFYDLSVSASEIVDRWDYDLSCMKFLGDSFPSVFPNFGPGVIAAFMGADLENGDETVWFHPRVEVEISQLRFKYNPDNPWLERIISICREGSARWKGLVQIGMTDLGGNLDVLSTFRPSGNLLFDLYDYPDEVRRLTWEMHEAWWRYFKDIDSEFRGTNAGYTTWTTVFSTEPHYMLQCDFSYMMGPEMFDEFVKPEIEALCRKLPRSFYHLDGPGQLVHLDSLLNIPELKGIQWVPGAGAPDYSHWPQVYRKIRDHGKLIQLFGDIQTLYTVTEQLGNSKGILFTGLVASEDEARECIDRYSNSGRRIYPMAQ